MTNKVVISIDEYRLHQMTLQRASKRFGSHEVLYSRYLPKIPASAEREYGRLTNAYMMILKEEIEKELPKLKEAYKKNRDAERKENYRNDGLTDIILAVSQIFNEIKNNILSRTAGFGLRRKLEALANLNRKLTVKEWKHAIKATLGIDIREDYYLGDFYIKELEKWISENVSLIKSIPEDSLEKMKDIIYDGFINGKTTTRIVKEIQKTYQVSRKKAELIARDQTAKLNGQIQRAQQLDAGIKEYIWSTTGDERVRKSHKKLNGKKFNWKDPPIVDERTGRKCHPGQDYQCRCIARPVFDRNTINLPIAADEETSNAKHNKSTNSIEQMSNVIYNMPKGANLNHWKKKFITTTIDEDAILANINYYQNTTYQINCQRCVPAYEMRRRGYDVTAQASPEKEAMMAILWRDIFEGANWIKCPKGNGLFQIEKTMKSFGDGARAEVYVKWKNSTEAHVFVAEQQNGRTIFIDPQSGSTDVRYYFEEIEYGFTELCRIDNLEPSNYIFVCCEEL